MTTITPFITSRQDKYTLSTNYCVISQVWNAAPTPLLNAFVVVEGTYPYIENYRRVATLNDLSVLAVNPLTAFVVSGAESFTGAAAGDVLTLASYTKPEHWISPLHAGGVAPVAPYAVTTFTILSVSSSQRLVINVTGGNKPFPSAASGLAWAITGGCSLSGVTGATQRLLSGQSGDSTLFLRPYYISVLPTVTDAQNRVGAIDAGLESLATNAKAAQGTFDGYDEGSY